MLILCIWSNAFDTQFKYCTYTLDVQIMVGSLINADLKAAQSMH